MLQIPHFLAGRAMTCSGKILYRDMLVKEYFACNILSQGMPSTRLLSLLLCTSLHSKLQMDSEIAFFDMVERYSDTEDHTCTLMYTIEKNSHAAA